MGAIAIKRTNLEGLLLVETPFHRDERGFLVESYHKARFAEQGIVDEFVQDNHSRSSRGVLRGIHYQDLSAPMAKLVRCTAGTIFDVAVDLRVGSPSFGKWFGAELSLANMQQLLVPVGFGHGFLTLSETADVQYKCSGYYAPAAEGTVAWNDPDIGISWPLSDPTVSPRDRAAQSLREYLRNPAFHYQDGGLASPRS